MALNRRNLMKFTAAGAATLAVSGREGFAARSSIDEIRDSALDYFGRHGLKHVPPLSLITGHTFNGGLRYDESVPEMLPGGWITIQRAARIEDIAQRDRDGVLASFNIITLLSSEQTGPRALFSRIMDFMVNELSLDPEKMLFVSTSHFTPHFSEIEGFHADQFMERSMSEANAAGDGSGVFAPEGHPHAPHWKTVGVYYPLPGGPDGAPLSYPPKGYIELAEISVGSSGVNNREGVQGASIGLERLALAEGKPIPTFEESRIDLLKELEKEAERDGKELPQGYTAFASL